MLTGWEQVAPISAAGVEAVQNDSASCWTEIRGVPPRGRGRDERCASVPALMPWATNKEAASRHHLRSVPLESVSQVTTNRLATRPARGFLNGQ